MADSIFIEAAESMTKDTIDVNDISRLSIGIDFANKGYVVFCKERSLFVSFYE